MILKNKDDRTSDIQELNRLLTFDLSNKQRFLIEREIKCLMSGNTGENSSAYYLDFRFKQTKNWALIHDLRIEHRGLVAQIDHLLINRFLEIYVLESKNYFYGIKITDDGEFLAYNGKGYEGIESPIEQNKRHIDLLQKTIEDRMLSPSRLGIALPVSFMNYVLVAPNARIDRPEKKKFDTTMVVKADAFASHLEKRMDSQSVVAVFASAAKMIGTDTLEDFANKLVRLHRPGKFDYAAKFGVTEKLVSQPVVTKVDVTQNVSTANAVLNKCENCSAEVDEKVSYFCRMNKGKFDGKILCRDCQQIFSTKGKADSSNTVPVCESCNAEVDSKVVYFCRLNRKKFNGKVLCRSCQQTCASG